MSGFWSYRGKDTDVPLGHAGSRDAPPSPHVLRSLLPSVMDTPADAVSVDLDAEHGRNAEGVDGDDSARKCLVSAAVTTKHINVDLTSTDEATPTTGFLPDTAPLPFAQATTEATALREVQARWWRDTLGVSLQAQSIASMYDLNANRPTDDYHHNRDEGDDDRHQTVSRDVRDGGSDKNNILTGEQTSRTRECEDVVAVERQLLSRLRPARGRPAESVPARVTMRRPAFVQRMEQRAMTRRAAWVRLTARQHAKVMTMATGDGASSKEGVTHAPLEEKTRSSFVVPRRVSPCRHNLRSDACPRPAVDAAVVTPRCGGARCGVPLNVATFLTQTAFVTLVQAIRRELGFALRSGNQAALYKELARVAVDYRAVRLVHRVLRRWHALSRTRVTNVPARETVMAGVTAAAQATPRQDESVKWSRGDCGVTPRRIEDARSAASLLAEECTARWCLMDEAAAQWRLCVELCHRRIAQLLQSAQRGRERQLQLLRWYFVTWAAAVEARRVRRAGQRYAAQLMQCAQDVLYSLPYTPVRPHGGHNRVTFI